MDVRAGSVEFNDSRGVPIAKVSSALGVPLPTLRSWEVRYAMPAIKRERGRHRRYLPAEVHAIRLMRDEIARGQQAALAAATVRKVLGIGGPAGGFIHRLLAGSEQLNPSDMRVTLDEAAAVLGLADCVDDVLLPGMRQIGIWWQIGHCDIAQEHISTEAVRGWLNRAIVFAPAPTQPRPVLLACGPHDWHTIGLEALAMLLRYRGWPCRLLGARVATSAVVAEAAASQAAAVVVVSQLATGRRAAVQSLRAAQQARYPVFYAGHSFLTKKSHAAVPGTYLGHRLQDATTRIITALTETDPPAAETTNRGTPLIRWPDHRSVAPAAGTDHPGPAGTRPT